jgi:chaperone modulatory protein CbpM
MSDNHIEISLSEICQAVELSEQKFAQLVENDIVQVKGADPSVWVFDITMVSIAKRAVRLHRDLDLDWSAISVIVELIEQRDQLTIENESLRRQLQRFVNLQT